MGQLEDKRVAELEEKLEKVITERDMYKDMVEKPNNPKQYRLTLAVMTEQLNRTMGDIVEEVVIKRKWLNELHTHFGYDVSIVIHS